MSDSTSSLETEVEDDELPDFKTKKVMSVGDLVQPRVKRSGIDTR